MLSDINRHVIGTGNTLTVSLAEGVRAPQKRSVLGRVVVDVKNPTMVQIDLLENYLYSVEILIT